jgi:hypothetical protein
MKNLLTKIKSSLATILVVLAILFLVSLVLGLPLMLLWNWLIPTIFGLTKITFFQAVGLNFLCSIMFKNSENSKKD